MRTAFVTGADRGLGFCLAEEFLKKGFTVFAGQYMPDWDFLPALKERYPEALHIVPLDVSSLDSVKAAYEYACAHTDRIDVFANVAGITAHDAPLGETPDTASLLKAVSTNSISSLRCINTFLPLLEKGEKRLGFVSSEAGSVECCARGGLSNYSVSKTALNMAIRLLFNELEPLGYRFRVYHPGWMRTWMSGKKGTMGVLEPEESAAIYIEQLLEDRDWEDTLVMLDNLGAAWPF